MWNILYFPIFKMVFKFVLTLERLLVIILEMVNSLPPSIYLILFVTLRHEGTLD